MDGNLISPVLLECIAQLRNVRCQIETFCDSDLPFRECVQEEKIDVELELSKAAHDIGNIIGQEVLSKTFYAPRE